MKRFNFGAYHGRDDGLEKALEATTDIKAKAANEVANGIFDGILLLKNPFANVIVAMISAEAKAKGVSFLDVAQFFYDNYELKHLGTFDRLITDLESVKTETKRYTTKEEAEAIRADLKD